MSIALQNNKMRTGYPGFPGTVPSLNDPLRNKIVRPRKRREFQTESWAFKNRKQFLM